MNVVTHIFFLRRCTVMIVFNSEAIHSYISALHLTIFISYANFVESQAKIRKNGACIQNSEQSQLKSDRKKRSCTKLFEAFLISRKVIVYFLKKSLRHILHYIVRDYCLYQVCGIFITLKCIRNG